MPSIVEGQERRTPSETLPETVAAAPAASEKTENGRRRKRALRMTAVVVPLLVIAVAVYYLFAVRPYETTDDAFIDGHAIQISPKVAGYVVALPIKDNQRVKKGDLLLQIDPRDYEVRLESARANLAAVESRLAQSKSQLTVAEAEAAQDHASVGAAEAEAKRAQTDLERYQSVESRAISQQQLDAAIATAQSNAAALEVARKKADASDAQVGLAKSQIATAEADVRQAEAAVHQAELDLSYTNITAPENGWVTHRTVEFGQYAQIGQGLLAIVAEREWVTANFKETQLSHMKPGQPVWITIDAFPAKKFKGRVDSIQAGTGAQFSLLPPENAVGNYVKVVQRVPVKIVFDEDIDPNAPLPLGASVVPKVKVR